MNNLENLRTFQLSKKQMNGLNGGRACADNEREFYCMTDWGEGYDIYDGAKVCGWDNLTAQDAVYKVYNEQGVYKGDYRHVFCY